MTSSLKKNQSYTAHHDDDYLRLIKIIKTQKPEYENVKISDIFYDEKNKNNRKPN